MTTAYVNGQDTLAFTNQNGITGTWTAGTGVLALSGTATEADYQTALRSITYTNSSDNPTTTTRAVTFVVNDGTENSNTASRGITLTAVNDAPALTDQLADLAYTENGSPVLAPAITATDADSANLVSATVTMTTDYVNGQDTLAFTNQNGITGTWTAGTGVLALTGSATVANYQTALRSITYTNSQRRADHDDPRRHLRRQRRHREQQHRQPAASRSPPSTTRRSTACPAPRRPTMNTPKVFSTGNGNLISISRRGRRVGTMQVQLVSTNGATTLSAPDRR